MQSNILRVWTSECYVWIHSIICSRRYIRLNTGQLFAEKRFSILWPPHECPSRLQRSETLKQHRARNKSIIGNLTHIFTMDHRLEAGSKVGNLERVTT